MKRFTTVLAFLLYVLCQMRDDWNERLFYFTFISTVLASSDWIWSEFSRNFMDRIRLD